MGVTDFAKWKNVVAEVQDVLGVMAGFVMPQRHTATFAYRNLWGKRLGADIIGRCCGPKNTKHASHMLDYKHSVTVIKHVTWCRIVNKYIDSVITIYNKRICES